MMPDHAPPIPKPPHHVGRPPWLRPQLLLQRAWRRFLRDCSYWRLALLITIVLNSFHVLPRFQWWPLPDDENWTMLMGLYLVGPIKRRSMRQALPAIAVGTLAYFVARLLFDALNDDVDDLLANLVLRVISFVPLGVLEWRMISLQSRGPLLRVVWACFVIAVGTWSVSNFLGFGDWMVEIVQPDGRGRVLDDFEKISEFVSLQEFFVPPLQSVLIWSMLPRIIVRPAPRCGLISRFRFAFVSGFVIVVALWFHFFGQFWMASHSIATGWPFPPARGILVLGLRRSPDDLERLFDFLRGSDWSEPPRQYLGFGRPEFDPRDAAIYVLQRSPEAAAEFYSERLRSRPQQALADAVAATLAQEKRYETAPILLRYSRLGSGSCREACVEMGVRWSGSDLLERWWSKESQRRFDASRVRGRGSLLAAMHASFEAYEGPIRDGSRRTIEISDELRQQLTELCGQDAGPTFGEWEDALERFAAVPERNIPIEVHKDVEAVHRTMERFRESVLRARDVEWAASQSQLPQFAERAGIGDRFKQVQQLYSQGQVDEAERVFQQGGESFSKTFESCMAEASKAARIPGRTSKSPERLRCNARVTEYDQRIERVRSRLAPNKAADPSSSDPR